MTNSTLREIQAGINDENYNHYSNLLTSYEYVRESTAEKKFYADYETNASSYRLKGTKERLYLKTDMDTSYFIFNYTCPAFKTNLNEAGKVVIEFSNEPLSTSQTKTCKVNKPYLINIVWHAMRNSNFMLLAHEIFKIAEISWTLNFGAEMSVDEIVGALLRNEVITSLEFNRYQPGAEKILTDFLNHVLSESTDTIMKSWATILNRSKVVKKRAPPKKEESYTDQFISRYSYHVAKNPDETVNFIVFHPGNQKAGVEFDYQISETIKKWKVQNYKLPSFQAFSENGNYRIEIILNYKPTDEVFEKINSSMDKNLYAQFEILIKRAFQMVNEELLPEEMESIAKHISEDPSKYRFSGKNATIANSVSDILIAEPELFNGFESVISKENLRNFLENSLGTNNDVGTSWRGVLKVQPSETATPAAKGPTTSKRKTGDAHRRMFFNGYDIKSVVEDIELAIQSIRQNPSTDPKALLISDDTIINKFSTSLQPLLSQLSSKTNRIRTEILTQVDQIYHPTHEEAFDVIEKELMDELMKLGINEYESWNVDSDERVVLFHDFTSLLAKMRNSLDFMCIQKMFKEFCSFTEDPSNYDIISFEVTFDTRNTTQKSERQANAASQTVFYDSFIAKYETLREHKERFEFIFSNLSNVKINNYKYIVPLISTTKEYFYELERGLEIISLLSNIRKEYSRFKVNVDNLNEVKRYVIATFMKELHISSLLNTFIRTHLNPTFTADAPTTFEISMEYPHLNHAVMYICNYGLIRDISDMLKDNNGLIKDESWYTEVNADMMVAMKDVKTIIDDYVDFATNQGHLLVQERILEETERNAFLGSLINDNKKPLFETAFNSGNEWKCTLYYMARMASLQHAPPKNLPMYCMSPNVAAGNELGGFKPTSEQEMLYDLMKMSDKIHFHLFWSTGTGKSIAAIIFMTQLHSFKNYTDQTYADAVFLVVNKKEDIENIFRRDMMNPSVMSILCIKEVSEISYLNLKSKNTDKDSAFATFRIEIRIDVDKLSASDGTKKRKGTENTRTIHVFAFSSNAFTSPDAANWPNNMSFMQTKIDEIVGEKPNDKKGKKKEQDINAILIIDEVHAYRNWLETEKSTFKNIARMPLFFRQFYSKTIKRTLSMSATYSSVSEESALSILDLTTKIVESNVEVKSKHIRAPGIAASTRSRQTRGSSKSSTGATLPITTVDPRTPIEYNATTNTFHQTFSSAFLSCFDADMTIPESNSGSSLDGPRQDDSFQTFEKHTHDLVQKSAYAMQISVKKPTTESEKKKLNDSTKTMLDVFAAVSKANYMCGIAIIRSTTEPNNVPLPNYVHGPLSFTDSPSNRESLIFPQVAKKSYFKSQSIRPISPGIKDDDGNDVTMNTIDVVKRTDAIVMGSDNDALFALYQRKKADNTTEWVADFETPARQALLMYVNSKLYNQQTGNEISEFLDKFCAKDNTSSTSQNVNGPEKIYIDNEEFECESIVQEARKLNMSGKLYDKINEYLKKNIPPQIQEMNDKLDSIFLTKLAHTGVLLDDPAMQSIVMDIKDHHKALLGPVIIACPESNEATVHSTKHACARLCGEGYVFLGNLEQLTESIQNNREHDYLRVVEFDADAFKTTQERKTLIDMYNHMQNFDGRIIAALAITKVASTGITFRHTRKMYFSGIESDITEVIQLMGRILRMSDPKTQKLHAGFATYDTLCELGYLPIIVHKEENETTKLDVDALRDMVIANALYETPSLEEMKTYVDSSKTPRVQKPRGTRARLRSVTSTHHIENTHDISLSKPLTSRHFTALQSYFDCQVEPLKDKDVTKPEIIQFIDSMSKMRSQYNYSIIKYTSKSYNDGMRPIVDYIVVSTHSTIDMLKDTKGTIERQMYAMRKNCRVSNVNNLTLIENAENCGTYRDRAPYESILKCINHNQVSEKVSEIVNDLTTQTTDNIKNGVTKMSTDLPENGGGEVGGNPSSPGQVEDPMEGDGVNSHSNEPEDMNTKPAPAAARAHHAVLKHMFSRLLVI